MESFKIDNLKRIYLYKVNKPLDINTATKRELEALPHIGPKTASQIIKHRKKHGPFLYPSAIMEVSGISEKTYDAIKDKIETNVLSDAGALGKKILSSAGKFIGSAIKKKARAWSHSTKKTSSKKKPPNSKRKIKKATGEIRRFKKYGSSVKSSSKSRSKSSRSKPNSRTSKKSSNETRESTFTDSKKLNRKQIEKAAKKLNIELATLSAVMSVESRGGGFLRNGKPKILFEGHIFWNQLLAIGINPKTKQRGNENVLYPKWTKRHYKGGASEYSRLEKAIDIHKSAALKSASWGMFQVMGFNYAYSHSSVEAFVQDMYQSEEAHLNAFIQFIKHKRLISALKLKDWARFARVYNGVGYRKNRYDEKLASAYQKYQSVAYV